MITHGPPVVGNLTIKTLVASKWANKYTSVSMYVTCTMCMCTWVYIHTMYMQMYSVYVHVGEQWTVEVGSKEIYSSWVEPGFSVCSTEAWHSFPVEYSQRLIVSRKPSTAIYRARHRGNITTVCTTTLWHTHSNTKLAMLLSEIETVSVVCASFLVLR